MRIGTSEKIRAEEALAGERLDCGILNNNLCCSQERDIKQQKCNSTYCQEKTIYSLENQCKYFSITKIANVLCRTGDTFRGYHHPEGMRLSFTGEVMLKRDINRTADERLDKSLWGAEIDASALSSLILYPVDSTIIRLVVGTVLP